MHLTCYFREARGKRTLREIAALADTKGITAGTLSMVEQGRLLPADAWVEGIERAYGERIADLYSPVGLLAIQEDLH